MGFNYSKETLRVVWVLAVGAAGVAAGVTSLAGWALLAGIALTALVVTWWLWTPPAESLSESIQNARR